MSEKFEVFEKFVGLYEVASTGAEIIYGVITWRRVPEVESCYF